MALACKCDRCGEYYDIPDMYVNRITVTETSLVGRNNLKDLCPDCTEKLREFMEGKNDGNCETL